MNFHFKEFPLQWQNDKFTSQWWNCYHNDEFSTSKLVYITKINSDENVEFSTKWWTILLAVMNSNMNFYYNEAFHYSDEFKSQCWIFILIMKELKNSEEFQHIG